MLVNSFRSWGGTVSVTVRLSVRVSVTVRLSVRVRVMVRARDI